MATTSARRRKNVIAEVVNASAQLRNAMYYVRRQGYQFYEGGREAWLAQYKTDGDGPLRSGSKPKRLELTAADWSECANHIRQAIVCQQAAITEINDHLYQLLQEKESHEA
jgi:hypothetical protein